MSRVEPRKSVGAAAGGRGQAGEDEPSPTRELIIRLEAQVSALTGAVRGLEERLPARVVSVEAAAEHLLSVCRPSAAGARRASSLTCAAVASCASI
jgi:hypothetical protein